MATSRQLFEQNYDRIWGKPQKVRARRSGGGGRCACPTGSRSVSTNGRGRGFVCQSSTAKKVRKHGRTWLIKKPFVRAIGC